MNLEILIAHLVGDYLLQNDWMANNKKKQSLPCFIHASLYATAYFLFFGGAWLPILLIFVEHFIQDRGNLVNKYMDMIGQKSFSKNLAPWSIIVVDNSIHLLFNYIVIKIFLSY